MKVDRNLILAAIGIVALGAIPAIAQQVNSGPGNNSVTTLGAGTNTIGSINNLGTITNPLPAGTNALGSVSSTALPATTTNGSSTVTTGGTFQSALAASATRKGCTIQNPLAATEPLYVYFGTGTASLTNSFGLNPGGSTSCSVGGAYIATDAIQITAATTGHAYVLNSQ